LKRSYPFNSLLVNPLIHGLIDDVFETNFSLASVYAQANSEIKRKIHHKIEIETAIEGMGTESPEFLKLVETCPNKAETLLIKLMHILTDKCKFIIQNFSSDYIS